MCDKIEVDGKLTYDPLIRELIFFLEDPIYMEALDSYLMMVGFPDMAAATRMFRKEAINRAIEGNDVFTSLDIPRDIECEDDISMGVYL
ncbi:MAG: hypothetical protein KKF16_08120 [Euryarchaeota archaeon]|nr:hypothetical protein [Euryarchaeota archaeon]MBU4607838.1 hypothetical protein [Euryarchaeota archaeon]MBV1729367.1 hypothetical protein [Methanobacterium sp.]MBV1754479.1 hypothetical protein [Methanobacterium sp.]MBV1766785.1 hypothetical protein [Methanobacterium sp.]